MAIYRAHCNLDIGRGAKFIAAGTLFDERVMMAESIQILVDMEHISRVQFPPLEVLPGWKARADRLRKAGIEDADTFLATDAATIAKAFRNISTETVSTWQAELLTMFTPSTPPER
jgi:hypothetical protein